jgi:hypothetical protein
VGIIFALAEQAETKSSIARTPNAKGLERRNGKPWTPRQITAILSRSDLYRDGCFSYGDASGTDDRLAILEPSHEIDAQGHDVRDSSTSD